MQLLVGLAQPERRARFAFRSPWTKDQKKGLTVMETHLWQFSAGSNKVVRVLGEEVTYLFPSGGRGASSGRSYFCARLTFLSRCLAHCNGSGP
jgi:hypothetical protein